MFTSCNAVVRMVASTLVGLLLSAWTLGAHAGVNPRNGNYFVTYADATLAEKGHELSMTRTYNSKSVRVGWFGYGWGSAFETRLTVMPDHTAAIAEIGSGAVSFFHDEATERDVKQVAAGVARIVAAATVQDKLDQDAVDALNSKLMGNEEERFNAVTQYDMRSELPRNLKLTAYGGGYCAGTLQRTASGYRRDDGCGKVEDFDSRGNLIRRAYVDGYQISFLIEHDRPVEIRDTDDQCIRLNWTQNGQVNRLATSNGVVVEYEYDDKHNLIMISMLDGITYRHDYDRNHNMTRIRYVDDSSEVMIYTAQGLTSSVTRRTGERTLYEYSTSTDDPSQYFTRIRDITADGSETVKMMSYQDSKSATGENHLQAYAIADQANGVSVELDERKRVKRKNLSSGEFIAYTYHPSLNKVTSVNLDDELIANFEYNAAGELTHAKNTSGQAVEVEYNAQKLIIHMITTESDGSHSDLHFKYDGHDKPVEIKTREGTVTVEYDSNGEISKVESDGGAIVALRIFKTFETMLELIKLAEI